MPLGAREEQPPGPQQDEVPNNEQFGPPVPAQLEQVARARGDARDSRPAQPEVLRGAEHAPEWSGFGPAFGRPEPMPETPVRTEGAIVEQSGTGNADKTTAAQPATSRPLAPPATPLGTPDGSPTTTPLRPGDVPAPTAAPGSQPGERSEKEADAASKVKPIEVILGRPAAGQGLEIITKRPKRSPFSLLTRVTALPINPEVEVKFDRMGQVAAARVVRSSGIEDVDAPVLAAVYGWTAKGARLNDLSTDDREAAITIRVTILLR